jgi:hypothetical protein
MPRHVLLDLISELIVRLPQSVFMTSNTDCEPTGVQIQFALAIATIVQQPKQKTNSEWVTVYAGFAPRQQKLLHFCHSVRF